MGKNIVALIMAGGLGKRMESNIPKVLHKINLKKYI
jgi:bifunctional N-acetylglucosamine-1-phosphate-uridyltransferase/glucosamine-1-phosphate-acetyltransferase GlmU-like protein